MQQQLSEAFTIMMTGMITVFVFLTLLLLAMGLLRRIAATDETSSVPPTAAQAKVASKGTTDKQRMAAISAALHAYRRDHE